MPSLRSPCPRCGSTPLRVIYAGLPAPDEGCGCMWGPGEWVARAFGFNGLVFVYGRSYWAGLLAWLRATAWR